MRGVSLPFRPTCSTPVGAQHVQEHIGVDATRLPFNSIISTEMRTDAEPSGNPLVNAGAIASVHALSPTNAEAWWRATPTNGGVNPATRARVSAPATPAAGEDAHEP